MADVDAVVEKDSKHPSRGLKIGRGNLGTIWGTNFPEVDSIVINRSGRYRDHTNVSVSCDIGRRRFRSSRHTLRDEDSEHMAIVEVLVGLQQSSLVPVGVDREYTGSIRDELFGTHSFRISNTVIDESEVEAKYRLSTEERHILCMEGVLRIRRDLCVPSRRSTSLKY